MTFPASSNYPAPHIVPASSGTHRTTLVLLHGTSSKGPEFASEILCLRIPAPELSDEQDSGSRTTILPELLPHTKFVFPTGRPRPTTVLGRESNAWFDFASFSDRTLNSELQVEGIRESVAYLRSLVKNEVEQVGGDGRKVVVLGFSQGAAMVGCMMALGGRGLQGNWAAMNGWMPFVAELEKAVSSVRVQDPEAGVREIQAARRAGVARYLRGILGIEEESDGGREFGEQRLWYAHGAVDKKMLPEWGTRMCSLFKNLGFRVEATEYEGLEHSYRGDELGDLVRFLAGRWREWV